MILFGDRVSRVRTAARLDELNAELRQLSIFEPGLARHAALAGAFIALGQIVQGVADADRARYGADGLSSAEARLMEALCALARAVIRSWDSGFASLPPLPDIALPPDTPGEIELHLPEGHAFYAIYPEAYVLAARGLAVSGPLRVIGIRSIGTGLAAIVAAELDAPPPFTVRPVGHPFHRSVNLSVPVNLEANYLVVDEGPGLSGSSFAAVADFLEAQGVAARRIRFLPSHRGAPGAQASHRTLRRWQEIEQIPADNDALLADRLGAWVADLLGPLEGPLIDISAGAWRQHVWPDEHCWPAVAPDQERRKFLARAQGQSWLLKFAGLGEIGARKLASARTLHAAGLMPEVRGLLHGFLVQRWVNAAPLEQCDPDAIEAAARYLAARAHLLPADGDGATIATLYTMARFNIAQALGSEAAEQMTLWEPMLPRLQMRASPRATDNRCDLHKWLRLADGRLLKADALDHHCSHDIIGCQDLAWDVAGVAVEFGLRAGELEALLMRLDRFAPHPIDRALLAFLTPCYIAFRLGAASIAADGLGHWPAEAARNRAAAARYADALGRLIARRTHHVIAPTA